MVARSSAMTAAWAAMVASRSGVDSGDGIVASGLRHCLRSVEVAVVGVETAAGADATVAARARRLRRSQASGHRTGSS